MGKIAPHTRKEKVNTSNRGPIGNDSSDLTYAVDLISNQTTICAPYTPLIRRGNGSSNHAHGARLPSHLLASSAAPAHFDPFPSPPSPRSASSQPRGTSPPPCSPTPPPWHVVRWQAWRSAADRRSRTDQGPAVVGVEGGNTSNLPSAAVKDSIQPKQLAIICFRCSQEPSLSPR
jgi:hypothetical protein